MELTRMTAAQLSAALAKSEVSATEVTQAHLDRIAAVDDRVHAFLHIAADSALAQAAEVDKRRKTGEQLAPLAGVPVAVKDVFTTVGMPTTCGSRILDGWHPPYDATITQRLKQAGAIILGKTNMDEFAMGSSTENSAFGPTRNPWDLDKVPGGSSGGSAAAVAAYEAPLAIGTDTGGSIRQPAAVCGIVGTKPTYGGSSRYGVVAFASSLDTPGPFGRTVLDAALLHEAISGHDPMDSTSIDAPVPPVVAAAREADVSGMRIGVVTDLSGDGYQPGVLSRFAEAVELLESLGAKVTEVSCPHFKYALPAYYLIAPSEASSNLARYDAMRYGLRVGDDGTRDAEEVMALTREVGFGAEVKRRIILGAYALSSGYYDAYYGKAQKVRTLIIRDFDAAFGQVDVLVSPATPTTAFRLGERADDPMAMYLADLCTIPSDLAGNAAISVPCGLAAEDGLPVGLQVMAPAMADDRLYRVAAAAEAAFTDRWGQPLLAGAKGLGIMTTTQTLVPFAEAVQRYDPLIGLETHVELGTGTKMFCGCPTAFGAEPNSQVCPVCLGLPGSLPVVNRMAIEYTIRIGLALNCSIATWCRFARKNYFYPDMPKNFQISQYDEPLCTDGWLDVVVGIRTIRVGIERVHLEEDTGKSLHVGGATGRIHGAEYSLVDYNRAGIPLVEVVTKPIEGTGADAPVAARAYVTELRDLLRSLGVSDVRMEEGSLRCDVNTSLAPRGSGRWGTRTETKNVNSLRSVERAVRFEIERQAAVLDSGGRVILQTRHLHEDTGTTTPGRSKEEAQDYRYFPEPDLVPVAPPADWVEQIKAALPETPSARRARLQAEWDLSEADMTALANAGALDLVADTVAAGASPADARKWWLGELARRANEAATELAGLAITPAQVARIAELVSAGTLNDRLAREVIDAVLDGQGTPDEIVEARGLAVVSDEGELTEAVDEAIAANPDVVARIRDGRLNAAGVLVGAVMKATRGQADATRVRELILKRLS